MKLMEELVQSDSSTNLNNEDDDEIYEKIEAPKFVDFTVPDPPPPLDDDRSWFCLRVGCDLKHEEDMDPDAVYKRFVLRVMAARSPNLRLRKVLNKQATSAKKCPLTAPAKSSKPRLSKLTAITSLSQKMADAKVKLHPISKLNLMTPHGKAKQTSVASKYMTTPRYKKCIPSRDPFRSVQNPKTSIVAMPRGRIVAKALVFNSPKKTEKRKTSLESQTPVTMICSEMKKLDIKSQAKQPSKPSSRIPHGPTASEAKKPKLYNHNIKRQVEISGDRKDKEAKSSRRPKRKSKEISKEVQCTGPLEIPDNDLSDMEIDEKSRNGSLDVCAVSGSSKSKEEEHMVAIAENIGATIATQEENLPSSSKTSLNGENRQTVSTDVATDKCTSSVSNSEVDLEEKDPRKEVENERDENEESNQSNIEEEEDKDVPILQPSNAAGGESEALFSDDKENASASEDNRESNLNDDNSQVKIHRHESIDQKVKAAVTKTSKVTCTVAANGSLGGKYKKAKPTNPKPFRLRTNERGILREAKLLTAPLTEITPLSKAPDGGESQRCNGNEKQQDEKSHGQCRSENDSQESNQAESDKRIQKIQPRQIPSYLKPLKREIEPKMSTTTVRGQKKFEDGKDKAAKHFESRTTAKSKSPLKPLQRVVRTRNATVRITPSGLSVIKETLTTVSRPKEAKPEMMGTPAGGRSSSRGKRRPTIPKEPNFHRIHTPKSCTKTPTKVIST